ncbi:MAG TPA: TetR/AcrR family transcriptional regulator [Pseudonocardia sp.]|jgi:AcrR family transcriptional regulator
MNTARLDQVLDATYECLTRYGVHRITMDDIATAADMSRSALYQYVRNKDDAVRRVAQRLHDRALERAAAAASDPATSTQRRIHGVLQAKLDLVLELAGDSPHTGALLDSKAKLYGDICISFTDRVRELLVELFTNAVITNAGSVTLAPRDAAEICVALAVGLESTPDCVRLSPAALDLLTSALLPQSTEAPV